MRNCSDLRVSFTVWCLGLRRQKLRPIVSMVVRSLWVTCFEVQTHGILLMKFVNQAGKYGGKPSGIPFRTFGAIARPMNTQQRLPDVLSSARVGVCILGKKGFERVRTGVRSVSFRISLHTRRAFMLWTSISKSQT